MKAALYARVSSDKQDVDLSISGQLRNLREYVLRNGYEIVREFVDEAESGRSASSRPAFNEMIALSKAKHSPFEVILVWKLSRFARNRMDSITYKALLRSRGIKLVSINEPLDDTPVGQLLEGIIESVDEFYSANLGQDSRRGIRENASRGFFNHSMASYGLHRVPVKDGVKTRWTLSPDADDSVSVRVTDDPSRRRREHNNPPGWRHWDADTEQAARNVESYFTGKGMKGSSGGPGRADYVYIF